MLTEFCGKVYGLEREDGLRLIAKDHLRDIEILEIEEIENFNRVVPGEIDLVLISTVLQHLTDQKVELFSNNLSKSIVKGGYVLLIENIDNELLGNAGDINSETDFLSKPRSLDFYLEKFSEFDLVDNKPRILEKNKDYDAGRLILLVRK